MFRSPFRHAGRPTAGAATPPATALDGHDLVLRYGGKPVVHSASLALRPGRATALVGPNGSGKSTLLRALSRLHRVDGGRVTLGGPEGLPERDAALLGAREFAREVTLFSQSRPAPQGLTVREVVAFGRHPYRRGFGGPTAEDRTGAVAFAGGLVAAVLVLALAGRAAGTAGTRLVLAGSATAMALDAATGMLLILFDQNTTGLFAWGSGSLAQLNIDASLRAVPLVVVVLGAALALSRRLDVMNLGDDAASTLGVPIRTTRVTAVLCAVLLTSTAVTLAGPIAFVGLGAPVLARLVAGKVRALRRHLFLVPAAGLLGALLILLADATLRAVQGADGAASIPTGVPTALLGSVVIVVLALRLRDTGQLRQPRTRGSPHGRPARSSSSHSGHWSSSRGRSSWPSWRGASGCGRATSPSGPGAPPPG